MLFRKSKENVVGGIPVPAKQLIQVQDLAYRKIKCSRETRQQCLGRQKVENAPFKAEQEIVRPFYIFWFCFLNEELHLCEMSFCYFQPHLSIIIFFWS